MNLYEEHEAENIHLNSATSLGFVDNQTTEFGASIWFDGSFPEPFPTEKGAELSGDLRLLVQKLTESNFCVSDMNDEKEGTAR